MLTDPAGADLCDAAGVPVLVVAHPRAVVGDLAARLYGRPAERLRLVAVTGTQGKTTTTRLAEAALTEAGVRAAVVGTVGTRVNGTDVATSLTTPEAPDLHALFAVMAEEHVEACAMEVSSHALVIGRVDGVVFDVACFTNLGRDHLDFHADEEEYFTAKADLFTPRRARPRAGQRRRRVRPPAGVGGDRPGAHLLDHRPRRRLVGRRGRVEPGGSSFTVHTPGGGTVSARVPLTGDYNVSNALCAIAALAEAGFDPATVAAGLATSSGVPGRLERVDAGQPFLAVVDYAHKPDAVTAALTALRPQAEGRLLIVLGGRRRPRPGQAAADGRDRGPARRRARGHRDNPRSEDPAAIRSAVLAGAAEVPAGQRAETHEEGDRRAAIRLAVSLAGPGDVLVVAGKGHEAGQEVHGTVHPFDDRDVLREELSAR